MTKPYPARPIASILGRERAIVAMVHLLPLPGSPRAIHSPREIAAHAGLRVGRIGIGDPRSRWGSCTHDGDLRYSWRLILAPDHVRRATVAHEVAHLRHMDHGADFHALVDELHDGDVGAARAWLRREGRGLHRYRFG